MSNVWWREDDILVTPALSTGVLPGVTRGAVAALAQQAGYRIREGSFTLPALLRAEEAFTSSAVREIMPIIAVDGRELPRGDAAPRAAGAPRGRAPTTTLASRWRTKLRLGGMALGNGVLVHGPTAWACAVRTEDGDVKVAAERKRLVGSRINVPLLRGPARLAEAFAVLPRLKRSAARGEAALRGTRRPVLHGRHRGRRSRRPPLASSSHTAQELVAGLLAVAPAVLSVRSGSLAGYHGAEHIAIGTYEQDAPTAKEHERCGSHLVGPLLLTTAAANLLASRAPRAGKAGARGWRPRSGAVAASTEIFGWMTAPPRPPARPRARPARATSSSTGSRPPSRRRTSSRWPRAALAACLELEEDA